jgi:hypothetical protein
MIVMVVAFAWSRAEARDRDELRFAECAALRDEEDAMRVSYWVVSTGAPRNPLEFCL